MTARPATGRALIIVSLLVPAMNFRIILLVPLLALLLFGCSQSPPPSAPANSTSENVSAPPAALPEPPSQPPAANPAPGAPPQEAGWLHYSNIGISFDYPERMNVTEQLGSYPGYATVVLQGKNVSTGAIVVGFINVSGIASADPDPLVQAARVLESDSKSKDDISGQAQVKGDISTYISPGGLPTAERDFLLSGSSSTGSNVTMHGYALEFYDSKRKAAYAVRIFSTDAAWTYEMKSRFVSSFKTVK